MKPHDEWNSADHARRAMHMEQIEYGKHPAKRARYVDTRWWLGLGIVAVVSVMVALIMLAGGMW